ncbi:MAG: hypothetical protein AAF928_02105 [Myxococcota bacterium]
MADFDHDAGFVPSPAPTGQLELDRYEAAYQQLYRDALDDGVITPEERQELATAARNLGLDPDRLAGLERALARAYEAHHGTSVLDTSRMFAPRSPASVPPPPPSSSPAAAPTVAPPARKPAEDVAPETEALRARVAYLEERVRWLTAELSEARDQVAYDVDFSDLDAPVPSSALDAPEALQRRLRHDPRDVTSLKSLYYAFQGQADRQYCVAQVLAFLDAADPEQRGHYEAHRPAGLISPRAALDATAWRRLVRHPEDDELTSDVLAIIARSVLLAHSARIKASARIKTSAAAPSGGLPSLTGDRRLDPETSTVQAARCFAWAAATFGMTVPPLFAVPDDLAAEAMATMVPTVPPSIALGGAALSGRTAPELAFLAGQQLAYFRPERFVRLLVPSVVDLQDLFLAALLIGNASLPLNAEVRGRVAPIAEAVGPLLSAAEMDELRGAYARFVEHGGVANLQRWGHAADMTAARAGFLLAGDLAVARDMATGLGLGAEVLDDLLVFAVSERHATLRAELGVEVDA